jgi:hypothetical protein
VERPVGPPRGQGSGRAPVPLVRLVTGLDRRQVEPNDVLRVSIQQPALEFGPDDVIRRRDDEGQVADDVWRVPKGSERADLGHVLLAGRFIGPSVAIDASGRVTPARMDRRTGIVR